MYSQQLLDERFSRYLLAPFGLGCNLTLMFLCWFSVRIVSLLLKVGYYIPYYWSISPFRFPSYLLYVSDILAWALCIFRIVNFLLLNWTLYFYVIILSLFTLKSILFDISMASSTFFWIPFAWTVSFCSFLFILCLSLEVK